MPLLITQRLVTHGTAASHAASSYHCLTPWITRITAALPTNVTPWDHADKINQALAQLGGTHPSVQLTFIWLAPRLARCTRRSTWWPPIATGHRPGGTPFHACLPHTHGLRPLFSSRPCVGAEQQCASTTAILTSSDPEVHPVRERRVGVKMVMATPHCAGTTAKVE
jgi:hypothetical protein